MNGDIMAQQETYPSPTAAQTGSGVSPYQQNHQDPADEHLDLNVQLQSAAQHQHDVHASMATQAYGAATAQMSQPNQSYGYPAATPIPFQGQISGISGPTPQTPEESARKKSKVTRACDECRRKKIKCDAESDAPGAPKCSNCQRTNADCKFSRAPQKRGPSKGYIKELSDRVAQLESGRGDFPDTPNVLASLGGDRKRTFSMTDYGYDQGSPFSRPDLPKSFAPAPVPEAHMHVNSHKAKSLGIVLASPETSHQYPMKPLHPAEERNMQDFLAKVNRVIPLLGSRDGINSNLAYCTPALRKAFYFSLGAVVGVLEGSTGELTRQQCADSVFNEMRQGGSLAEDNPDASWDSRPYQANLVYLQTILLCALYHQSSGPASPDPFGAFTCTQLLEQARKMVEYLKLRYVTEIGHLGPGQDASRVFSNVRRAFWVFIVLDAWNSLGTRASRMMPYFSANTELTNQDESVLSNKPFFEFIRRSTFAGAMGDRLRTVRANSSAVVDAGLDTYQNLHLAFGDGSVESSPNSPDSWPTSFATLAFASINLLCAMLYAGPTPIPATNQIVDAATRVASLLNTIELPNEGTPLTHHFIIPALKALLRAADYPQQRPVAVPGLRDILTAIRTKGILDASPWYSTVTRAIEDKLNDDKSMRGLANAAAGELAGSESGLGSAIGLPDPNVAWPTIVTQGYLNGPL